MRCLFFAFVLLVFSVAILAEEPTEPFVVVLGTAQDGGYPQAGCSKTCCQRVYDGTASAQQVSCLALVDPRSGKAWLFDATPHFPSQIKQLGPWSGQKPPSGIFLTHAHIGHYSGLMHLGREVMGSQAVPVYAMPRMSTFLKENGPWGQLVTLKNIVLQEMVADTPIVLAPDLSVTPFLVPHRDEYSETVGFVISGPKHKIAFIPDIDKWQRWDRSITELITSVDAAFLDATFYAESELPGRNMKDIPHPLVTESMALFDKLPPDEKQKVFFIHFNHSNPLLHPSSPETRAVTEAGYRIAKEASRHNL